MSVSGARDAGQEEIRTKSTFREYAEALVVALALALFIRTFFIQAFKIPSGSMLETLQIGDHLLVNKFLYGLRQPFSGERFLSFFEPERGDIIVFVFPDDPAKDFIKRIVGVPGDARHHLLSGLSDRGHSASADCPCLAVFLRARGFDRVGRGARTCGAVELGAKGALVAGEIG